MSTITDDASDARPDCPFCGRSAQQCSPVSLQTRIAICTPKFLAPIFDHYDFLWEPPSLEWQYGRWLKSLPDDAKGFGISIEPAVDTVETGLYHVFGTQRGYDIVAHAVPLKTAVQIALAMHAERTPT